MVAGRKVYRDSAMHDITSLAYSPFAIPADKSVTHPGPNDLIYFNRL
jgi:hypothetical protein